MTSYKTAPRPIKTLPPGIPFIVGNEGAERFSYYGMRAILVVFMTQYLLNATGAPDLMSHEEAKTWYHLSVTAVYFTGVFGALLSDGLLGKYRTIIVLSLVYCLGHLALAIDHTRIGLFIGLSLIALGAGGIKPCVSAHVGDQFGPSNKHLLSRVFSWFYFSINLGAFISMLLTPWLLDNVGPSWAFGLPGILMLLATIIFWSGRYRFVHIPAAGKQFVSEVFSGEGFHSLLHLCLIYVFVAMFWALFDQTGSAWVLQAQQMDQTMFGMHVLPSQIQAANPLLILVLIPTFSYIVYPQVGRYFVLTPLRKITIGFFVTTLAFYIPTAIQTSIDAGGHPSIWWQVLAYVVLTCSEILVSITCLEFSYTQAPQKMKSFVMAFYMLSVAAGNLFTALVNYFIQNPDGSSKLAGAEYYWFFTLLMLATAILFSIVSRFYRGKTYIHDEVEVTSPNA